MSSDLLAVNNLKNMQREKSKILNTSYMSNDLELQYTRMAVHCTRVILINFLSRLCRMAYVKVHSELFGEKTYRVFH